VGRWGLLASNRPEAVELLVRGEEDMSHEWAWMEASGEAAYGPFATREEAVEDARKSTESESVVIGKTTKVVPRDWAPGALDVDDILERMDEHAADVFSYDDSVFVLSGGTQEEAEKALGAMMADWAEEWLDSQCGWYLSGGDETVIC